MPRCNFIVIMIFWGSLFVQAQTPFKALNCAQMKLELENFGAFPNYCVDSTNAVFNGVLYAPYPFNQLKAVFRQRNGIYRCFKLTSQELMDNGSILTTFTKDPLSVNTAEFLQNPKNNVPGLYSSDAAKILHWFQRNELSDPSFEDSRHLHFQYESPQENFQALTSRCSWMPLGLLYPETFVMIYNPGNCDQTAINNAITSIQLINQQITIINKKVYDLNYGSSVPNASKKVRELYVQLNLLTKQRKELQKILARCCVPYADS